MQLRTPFLSVIGISRSDMVGVIFDESSCELEKEELDLPVSFDEPSHGEDKRFCA